MKSNVLTFLQETLQRLFIKSPRFFKIWGIIAGALVLITGIPEFLNLFPDVNIPDLWNEKVTLAVSWASRAAFIMAMLTVQSKPIGVTDTGEVIKVTNDKKLPFTAATEQQSAKRHNVSSVELNEVGDRDTRA